MPSILGATISTNIHVMDVLLDNRALNVFITTAARPAHRLRAVGCSAGSSIEGHPYTLETRPVWARPS